MNFFQHQDDARRTTRRLVFLFSLSVISIILITNLAVICGMWVTDSFIFPTMEAGGSSIHETPDYAFNFFEYLEFKRVLTISTCVIGVIALVILAKRGELSHGGKVVAEHLGGKLISPDTKDLHEKMVINVVEEMAIASGTAVPPVYLLPETGINAFAAGFNPSDAVIGISRGAIQNLDRDQIQGVIAHEFSHILNGDMRLNINLIAVLAGILFIGHAGYKILRASSRIDDSRAVVIPIVGFLLLIIGFLGTFFGNLIKAAVSRQREFLADASAVQFTRNPSGISGALKLIGGTRYGSLMLAQRTEEYSHMYFSNALGRRLSSFFATHPPVDERIRRIEPRWDGKYLEIKNEGKVQADSGEAGTADKKEAFLGAVATAVVVDSLEQSVDQVGEPNAESYQKAKQSLDALGELGDAVRKVEAAKALMFLLLLDSETESRKKQIDFLNNEASADTKKAMQEMHETVRVLPIHERLDLVELAIPALKTMSKSEYEQFLSKLVFLVKADNRIELFEWLLHRLLVHYLKPQFSKVETSRPKYRSLSRLKRECAVLLSHLSHFGKDESAYPMAFAKGAAALEMEELQLIPQDSLKVEELDRAIHHFAHLFPLVKPRLLKACAACIQADGHVNAEQMELLRALSALIDCPMPLMELNSDHD